jgi:hypothetical protein
MTHARGFVERLPAYHCATSSGAFGASPKISGAYIASTRVARNRKFPALFSRTV